MININYMKSNESLQISFGGLDEIDLDTLQTSLDATLKTLNKIAYRTMSKDEYCRFVVKNVSRGSFIVDINVIKEVCDYIVPIGTVISGVFVGIAKFRKFLKGRKPDKIKKDGDNVIVNMSDNSQTIIASNVFEIYTDNNDIENEMAKMSDVSANDDTRSDLKITSVDETGKTERVIYTKQDLSATSKAQDVESFVSGFNEYESTMWVEAKKIDFKGDAKWEFVNLRDNKVITASIADLEFLEQIRSGAISISAFTIFQIKLLSRIKVDSFGNPVGKPKDTVLQVLDYKERHNEQIKMKL